MRSRCPAGTVEAARVTFLAYTKDAKDDLPVPEQHFKCLRIIQKCTDVHRCQLTCAILTEWIVTGHWELHGRLALHVDNVMPLYCFHVAQLLAGELDSSVENLCKSKTRSRHSPAKPRLARVLHFCLQCGLTRKAVQEKLTGALASGFVKIGKHRESKLLIEERVAPNDAQVVEGNRAHSVESDEDVAAHFFNGLWKTMSAKTWLEAQPKIMSASNIKVAQPLQPLAVPVLQPLQHTEQLSKLTNV